MESFEDHLSKSAARFNRLLDFIGHEPERNRRNHVSWPLASEASLYR